MSHVAEDGTEYTHACLTELKTGSVKECVCTYVHGNGLKPHAGGTPGQSHSQVPILMTQILQQIHNPLCTQVLLKTHLRGYPIN